MKILHVVGARPNFMKVAPVMRALDQTGQVSQVLVHTGQHYDPKMSAIFFQELGVPEPDINLGVGSASHTVQVAEIMLRFEKVVQVHRPDLTLVYGDVNSTIAAALVCARLQTPVGHVEAGLRSFDRSMPEEINRILTDQIAELLFTPSADADANLAREGVCPVNVFQVGNVMIDTLVRMLRLAEQIDLGHLPASYGLVTLHRPSNVDDPQMLAKIAAALEEISQDLALIFPIHPRTREQLVRWGINLPHSDRLQLLEPAGYLEFLAMQRRARLVITDSGGIQEETTYLGVPCLTLRPNTERPITVMEGTNTLIGSDMDRLRAEVGLILNGQARPGQIPPGWDGQAGERIAGHIRTRFG